ncbi:hypothetical protein C8J57DRAFT_1617961, partial [Mycena rebaudengoi]
LVSHFRAPTRALRLGSPLRKTLFSPALGTTTQPMSLCIYSPMHAARSTLSVARFFALFLRGYSVLSTYRPPSSNREPPSRALAIVESSIVAPLSFHSRWAARPWCETPVAGDRTAESLAHIFFLWRRSRGGHGLIPSFLLLFRLSSFPFLLYTPPALPFVVPSSVPPFCLASPHPPVVLAPCFFPPYLPTLSTHRPSPSLSAFPFLSIPSLPVPRALTSRSPPTLAPYPLA